MVNLTIDDIKVSAAEGTTLLDAARQAGIYIPHICAHPDLPPVKSAKPAEAVYRSAVRIENKRPDLQYEGCQLCVVNIEGQKDLLRACNIPVAEGMVVRTNTSEAKTYRQDRLALILAKHPHACLTCAQREGCARFPCSMHIPEKERCCVLFGNCELQKAAEYIGIKPETPRYVFEDSSVINDEPLFERNYNLCIGCTRCVRACRDLRGIEALDFVFNKDGRMVVGNTGPTPAESACKFCTACVGVCPTGALLDKAEFDAAPCQTACPAGIDVPQYVYLCGEGKFAEAAAILHEAVPFPRTLGYICPHPCEAVCRRGEVNEAISIRALKRVAAENDDRRWKANIKPTQPTGKKVAVVGSGPSGLTAAYYLARLGHSVTVFEAAPKPGGMMWAAIPRFLLPQEVLDEEINEILSAGVELKLNNKVNDIAGLLKGGYDAALLAIGLTEGRRLPIPGSELQNVLVGLDFLRDISEGKPAQIGKSVLVLGGGGVACDVARTAKRLGAEQVSMACLESRETMPTPENDIKQTEAEGIEIYPARSFGQITCPDGKNLCVQCLNVKEMEFDEQGRLHLETAPGSEHVLEAETVIFATGQGLDRKFASDNRLAVTARGIIQAKTDTLETNLNGVFAGGDAVSGPASVVQAIATGRKAAAAIDKYLGGTGAIDEQLSAERESPGYMGREEGFAKRARAESELLPAQERVFSFKCVEFALSDDQARAEGGRCLKCDSRFNISNPVLPLRQKLWVDFTAENIEKAPETEGIYQLLDEQENVIYIKGAINLRRELHDQLELNEKASYFFFETGPFYTKRESQLLQQYIAQHGQMPEGNRALDDLF